MAHPQRNSKSSLNPNSYNYQLQVPNQSIKTKTPVNQNPSNNPKDRNYTSKYNNQARSENITIVLCFLRVLLTNESKQ